ncbi:hypothetical protein KOW79_000646 [Hemibagrus wyckioides]|uniref:Uncharacterized protein n=1 Tax=Hemibagrus wyckioides TaxID=337641 RepID=A0A9D3PAQ5_9TELE|nr:hypothetical protein KOW79_000646 [Hemibagrus wyckioides]
MNQQLSVAVGRSQTLGTSGTSINKAAPRFWLNMSGEWQDEDTAEEELSLVFLWRQWEQAKERTFHLPLSSLHQYFLPWNTSHCHYRQEKKQNTC